MMCLSTVLGRIVKEDASVVEVDKSIGYDFGIDLEKACLDDSGLCLQVCLPNGSFIRIPRIGGD